tara:strand:- start:7700 stop:8515 length:816 start_codon:yes stop_codon:yes gene_type:complete
MAKGRKVGPGQFLKRSPNRFIEQLVGGVSNIIGGSRALKRGKRAQSAAEAELREQRAAYEGLDTSNLAANAINPYANIQTQFENTFEDLTVNQQQAQFQAQQGAQQRSNIMQGLRGAAGGSGIAGLAQAMANQGQLATQQASASIGQQEAANQRAMAQGAAGVQRMEAAAQARMGQGEQIRQQAMLKGAADARGLEYQKTTNLLGMASGELQAANKAVEAARAQRASGWSAAIGGVASAGMAVATGGMSGLGQAALGQEVTPTNDSLFGGM